VEIAFLTLDEVIAIHRDQIARYGGSFGVRDWGLLRSAVAMPKATFSGRYLHTDLHEMAAAYLFHVARNHPFIDGNKRVAAVATDVFLALNGVRLTASEDQFAELVHATARGEVSKSGIAEFLRSHAQSA
jgi:death-on-curing protein